MKKSKAIIILLCALLVLLGVGYVDLYGVDAEGTASASDISLGLDLAGGVSITYQVVGDEEPDATDMADTIANLQKRDENYSKEAIVYQEGTDRINIEIPRVTDANKILEELGRPGSLYFIAETDKDGNANYSMQAVTDAQGNVSYAYALNKTIDELKADGSIMLEGTDVKTATAGSIKDQTMGNSTYAVDLVMTEEGTKKFEEATRNAYEKGETLGIYYDGSFVSVPSVKGVFSDGNAQISPMNSYEEAESLASTIRIGGLKLELEELHSKVVGAQLGVEAISTSLKAAVIGFIVVAVFMIAVYFLPGFASVIALGIYVALVVLLLNGFDLTLTLSGIAGIILSIGMAVDANVLIYERTKEELRAGKGVKKALADGYSNAFSAIFDSNLTSIITGIILFNFGTGPIRGFATTLIIGILISFFTAVFMTRLFYEHFMNKDKLLNLTFSTGISKNLMANVHFDFMGRNKLWMTLAGVAVVVCIGFLSIRGLSQSIDFTGGRNFKVQFENKVEPEQVRELISSKFGDANVSVIAIGADCKTLLISTNYRIEEEGNNIDSEIEAYLYETLKPLLTQNITLETFIDRENHTGGSIISSQKVGPSIADDIKTSAIWSVVLALIAIGLYILIRFRNIAFSIGATVALTVDTLLIIGAYSLCHGWMPFSLEIDQTFIGAILTAIGYSINDKVEIFDRVREFLGLYPKRDRVQLFNDSLNTTLSRTINTSLSTLIVLLSIFILGGDSIRSFAFAMILGVVIGTLSSLFIAAPVAYLTMGNKMPKGEEAKA